MKTEYRIVPVIDATGMMFEVQRKTFLFWKTMGEPVGSAYGTYYREELFNSIKDARDTIEKRYGQNAIYNLVSYKP